MLKYLTIGVVTAGLVIPAQSLTTPTPEVNLAQWGDGPFWIHSICQGMHANGACQLSAAHAALAAQADAARPRQKVVRKVVRVVQRRVAVHHPVRTCGPRNADGPDMPCSDTVGAFGGFGEQAHLSYAYESYKEYTGERQMLDTAINCILPATIVSIKDKEGPKDRAVSIMQDSHLLATRGPKGFIPTGASFGICMAIGLPVGFYQRAEGMRADYEAWRKKNNPQ
jgi:hypothetical protein